MSAKAPAVVLGFGLLTLLGLPLIGVVAAFTADRICDWHYRRAGLRDWSRRPGLWLERD